MRGVCSSHPTLDPLILWHWAMCLYSSSTGTDWVWEFSISSRLSDREPTSIWHRWERKETILTLSGQPAAAKRGLGDRSFHLDILFFFFPLPVTSHSPPPPRVCSPLWADSTFISPLPVAISFYLEVTDVNLSAKSATYLSMWAAVLQSGPCAAVSHSPAGKATYGHTWPARPTYPHISSCKRWHRKSGRLAIILSSRDRGQSITCTAWIQGLDKREWGPQTSSAPRVPTDKMFSCQLEAEHNEPFHAASKLIFIVCVLKNAGWKARSGEVNVFNALFLLV